MYNSRMRSEFRNFATSLKDRVMGIRLISKDRRTPDDLNILEVVHRLGPEREAYLLGVAIYLRSVQAGKTLEEVGLPFILVSDLGKPDIIVRATLLNGKPSDPFSADRTLAESRPFGDFESSQQRYLRVQKVLDAEREGVAIGTIVHIPNHIYQGDDPLKRYGEIQTVPSGSLLLIDQKS